MGQMQKDTSSGNRTADDSAPGVEGDRAGAKPKLKRKAYEEELRKLHVDLVKLQEWVRHKGQKVCIVFEGRDGAGKGGVIKAITARVSPRVFRVVALPAPTEREKSQMYIQRYLPHLPAGGEVVIFDRSWYNRAASSESWERWAHRRHRGQIVLKDDPGCLVWLFACGRIALTPKGPKSYNCSSEFLHFSFRTTPSSSC